MYSLLKNQKFWEKVRAVRFILSFPFFEASKLKRCVCKIAGVVFDLHFLRIKIKKICQYSINSIFPRVSFESKLRGFAAIKYINSLQIDS